ncbi:dephospho-CoA kinase [Sphingomonas sp. DBB INV C78]|uniref:dephospho-CoA kinase n=1 Tax=Sphingomonas sp. DBB INV C78 TaxID=3349434 RepID=UPI0036D34C8C
MKTLGLTGSIGMGKSTVAAMFRAEGVPVFDADAEVHRLQGPGSKLLEAIEALHPGTTSPELGVDRALLRQAVWGDDVALARLERLLYPALHRVRLTFLSRHRARRLVVLDVPLLFEKGGWRKMDAIAVVSAPAWIQRRRVLARPGMTAARLAHILSLQTPDPEKRRRADFVIDTGRSMNATREQVRCVIACLSGPGGR